MFMGWLLPTLYIDFLTSSSCLPVKKKADQNLSAGSFSVKNWAFRENRIFLFSSGKMSPLFADVNQNPRCLGVFALL